MSVEHSTYYGCQEGILTWTKMRKSAVFVPFFASILISGTSIGDCLTDSFSVTSPGNSGSPVICGTNTGAHSNFLFLWQKFLQNPKASKSLKWRNLRLFFGLEHLGMGNINATTMALFNYLWYWCSFPSTEHYKMLSTIKAKQFKFVVNSDVVHYNMGIW